MRIGEGSGQDTKFVNKCKISASREHLEKEDIKIKKLNSRVCRSSSCLLNGKEVKIDVGNPFIPSQQLYNMKMLLKYVVS